MKRSAIWSALVLSFLPAATQAAPESVSTNPAVERPISVSLELLGKGGLYSLNVEGTVGEYFTLGGGFSYLPLPFQTASSNGGVSDGNNHLFVFPVYATFSPNTGNHRFLMQAGATWGFVLMSNEASFSATPLVGIGYEYRAQGGFLFRATGYTLASFQNGFSASPWIGLSFGYAL